MVAHVRGNEGLELEKTCLREKIEVVDKMGLGTHLMRCER